MKTNQKQQNKVSDGWEILRFNGVCNVIDGDRGVNYPSEDDLHKEGYCLFLSAKNVTKNGFVFNTTSFITKEKDAKMSKGKVQEYDIALTTRGSIGNIAYADESVPFDNMRINSGMVLLRSLDNILPQYFYSFLFSQFMQKQFYRIAFGSAQPQLTVKDIKRFFFLLPPIPEQKRIVAVLETWDEVIEKLKRKVEIKKNIKKGLMQKLLTGKKRLPGFSGEWEVKKLGDVGEIVTGNTPPKKDLDNYGTEFFWATAEDFNSKYVFDTKIKMSEKGMKLSRFLPKNSILITCIASIGKNAIAKVPLATNQQINSIIVNDKNNFEFVYYLINNSTNILKRYAGGGALLLLNKLDFSKIKLLFPNLKEQKAIAKILTTADEEIEQLEGKLTTTQEQKRFLLNNLVSGDIRTPEDLEI